MRKLSELKILQIIKEKPGVPMLYCFYPGDNQFSEADYSEDNMKNKIKKFKNFKDPYILILGDQEAENNTVSVNLRGNKQMKDVPLDTFIKICQKLNRDHSLELIESVDEL